MAFLFAEFFACVSGPNVFFAFVVVRVCAACSLKVQRFSTLGRVSP